MKASQNCIDMIKRFEGCVLQVYLDAVGIKTLGYGHTGSDVNALPVGARISQQQADYYLSIDIIRFENNVNKYDPVYHWTQSEFDALVSFAFNLGSIDKLTNKGTRNKEIIAKKILEYDKAGGKVLSGLTKRRKAEHDLFVYGKVESELPTLKVGSKGEYVKNVQIYLSLLGYQVGKIDGIYGNQTASCVKHYQEENGLKIDGIWGKQCWNSADKK